MICPLIGRRGWETMTIFSYTKAAMEWTMKVPEVI